jgi:hypothetical protein
MGHADESMSDLYDKTKEDVEFRSKWAEKCGFGFDLPSVVRMYRKWRKKTKREWPLKSFLVREKDGRGERI